MKTKHTPGDWTVDDSGSVKAAAILAAMAKAKEVPK